MAGGEPLDELGDSGKLAQPEWAVLLERGTAALERFEGPAVVRGRDLPRKFRAAVEAAAAGESDEQRAEGLKRLRRLVKRAERLARWRRVTREEIRKLPVSLQLRECFVERARQGDPFAARVASMPVGAFVTHPVVLKHAGLALKLGSGRGATPNTLAFRRRLVVPLASRRESHGDRRRACRAGPRSEDPDESEPPLRRPLNLGWWPPARRRP